MCRSGLAGTCVMESFFWQSWMNILNASFILKLPKPTHYSSSVQLKLTTSQIRYCFMATICKYRGHPFRNATWLEIKAKAVDTLYKPLCCFPLPQAQQLPLQLSRLQLHFPLQSNPKHKKKVILGTVVCTLFHVCSKYSVYTFCSFHWGNEEISLTRCF